MLFRHGTWSLSLVCIAIKLLGFIAFLNSNSPAQCVVLCIAYLPYSLRTTLQKTIRLKSKWYNCHTAMCKWISKWGYWTIVTPILMGTRVCVTIVCVPVQNLDSIKDLIFWPEFQLPGFKGCMHINQWWSFDAIKLSNVTYRICYQSQHTAIIYALYINLLNCHGSMPIPSTALILMTHVDQSRHFEKNTKDIASKK